MYKFYFLQIESHFRIQFVIHQMLGMLAESRFGLKTLSLRLCALLKTDGSHVWHVTRCLH